MVKKKIASSMFWKVPFLSSCLLLWNHLLIMNILPEAASETPPPPHPTPHDTGGNSKDWWASIQPLKMPTVNHPPEVVRHDGKTGSSETLIGWKSGKITEWRERGYGLCYEKYTVTCFKIISGFQNRLQNHRRVSVCRNKQFEEGYLKDFHNC
jgi:hypothetical protein